MSRFKSSIPLLAIAYGLSAVANFLLSVVVGRRAGAEALGDFAFAVATSRLFFTATDLGIASHVTRVLSRDRSAAPEFASTFTTFRLALIPIAIVVVAATGIRHGAASTFAPIAIALGMISLQGIYEALLLGHDRQTAAAGLNIFTACCVAGGCAGWFVARGTLLEFCATYAGVSVLGVAGWWWWTGSRLQLWPRWQLDFERLRREIDRSWPIGVSNVLGIAALRAPVLALGAFCTSADVGAFSAVDMFVTAAAILQAAVSSATYPKLASTFHRDPARFRRLFWISNLGLLAVGLMTATFLTLFGTQVIGFVFSGKGFSASPGLIRIIAWSAPSLLLVHHNILVFAAADHERRNLRLMIAWCASLAIFQMILVPSHGLFGAAWGVLIGRLVGLAVLWIAIVTSGIHRGGTAGTELVQSGKQV